jgi:hypothetical protein
MYKVCTHYNVVFTTGGEIYTGILTSKNHAVNSIGSTKAEVVQVCEGQYLVKSVYCICKPLKPYLSEIPKNDPFYNKFYDPSELSGAISLFNKDSSPAYSVFSSNILDHCTEAGLRGSIININNFGILPYFGANVNLNQNITNLINSKNNNEL